MAFRKNAALLFCSVLCLCSAAAVWSANNRKTTDDSGERELNTYTDNCLFALREGAVITAAHFKGSSFDEGFTDEEKARLQYELPMPDIELIYRSEDAIIYLESSNYNYLPLQASDLILWEYKDGECTRLLYSSGIFWDIQVTPEEGTIRMEIDDDSYLIEY